MNLRLTEARDSASGTRLYLPDPEDPNPSIDTAFAYTEAEVGGINRLLRSDVLAMMLQFNADQSGRTALKHDAHVFALACHTGDNQRGISFDFKHGGAKVQMSDYVFQFNDDEPLADDGDVIAIYDTQSEEIDDLRVAQRHLIVKASIDNDESIYLSKLGIKGAVAAHTYDDIRRVYPYEYPRVALIGSLVRVDSA